MKISQSFKQAINNAFVYVVFVSRDADTILKMFESNIHGSNFKFLPPIDNVIVESIDDTHDKLTLIYDDYSVEGVVTWKPSANGINYVFVKYE